MITHSTKDKETQCPLDASLTIQKYFVENRSRILDIAAYLDRIDRSQNPEKAKDDFRMAALQRALEELTRPGVGRVEKIHEILSDPTLDPLESPALEKSAWGAYSPSRTQCC